MLPVLAICRLLCKRRISSERTPRLIGQGFLTTSVAHVTATNRFFRMPGFLGKERPSVARKLWACNGPKEPAIVRSLEPRGFMAVVV